MNGSNIGGQVLIDIDVAGKRPTGQGITRVAGNAERRER